MRLNLTKKDLVNLFICKLVSQKITEPIIDDFST